MVVNGSGRIFSGLRGALPQGVGGAEGPAGSVSSGGESRVGGRGSSCSPAWGGVRQDSGPGFQV